MEIGNRIKELREKSKYTQNGLADRAGISQSHLRRVELGHADITVGHLQLICDALGITLHGFFSKSEENDELATTIASLTPKQQHLLLEFLKTL
ncbi:MAG: helix-turn-helix domain-containing protein [Clostridia bacterium]|nr:helix-turn-helix domain-containing protein [Clostridia bacterium]